MLIAQLYGRLQLKKLFVLNATARLCYQTIQMVATILENQGILKLPEKLRET